MNIRDVMTPNPRSVSSNESIQNAARIMRDEDTGAVPVVENGRPVGIVSIGDLAVKEGKDSRTGDTLQAISEGVKERERG